MIVDSLARSALYRDLLPGLAAGFDYLLAFEPDTPSGRHEIEGERVFAVVDRYHTAPGTEKRFETHRRHLDIQLVVSGRERILHAPLEALELAEPHDEARDVAFYHDPKASSSVLMLPGDFAILLPGDGHKPGCMAGGREAVTKVVVKVALER